MHTYSAGKRTNHMEELKMKKLIVFAVLPLLVAAGCTTQYQAKAPYDDVYYSSRDLPPTTSSKVVVKQSQVPVATDYTASSSEDTAQQTDNQASNATEYSNYEDQPSGVVSESYSEPGGDTYINNNFYDNYYDYAYASRLRRFHSNYYANSYYDDYYSNMYYYDYDPWSWGTSIYFNSGWYSPAFGLSFGWGWPSYSYGYGNYWNGYYDGYYDGYYSGNYNNGWYSNEGGSNNNSYHYYGHRGQSGFLGGSSNGRNNIASRDQKTGQSVNPRSNDSENNSGYGIGNANRVSERNDVSSGGTARGGVISSTGKETGINGRLLNKQNSQSQPRSVTPVQVNEKNRQNSQTGRTSNPGYRGRYIAPSQNILRKPNSGNVTTGRQGASQPRIANPLQPVNARSNSNPHNQVSSGRENVPSNSAQPARTYQQQGARIQSYSSPSYSKPRSSQEYTTPKYRNIRNNENSGSSPQYSQPQQQSTPSGNYERRSSESPRQSSTQPSSERQQQSSPSYSAPSRSSENSYSAPARSNSNSNSSSTPTRSSSNSSESGRPRR